MIRGSSPCAGHAPALDRAALLQEPERSLMLCELSDEDEEDEEEDEIEEKNGEDVREDVGVGVDGGEGVEELGRDGRDFRTSGANAVSEADEDKREDVGMLSLICGGCDERVMSRCVVVWPCAKTTLSSKPAETSFYPRGKSSVLLKIATDVVPLF